MKKVELGLGPIVVCCFYGESEFARYAKLQAESTGAEAPKYNPECLGLACINGIWVADGNNAIIMAHELIHLLSLIHDVLGIKEEQPKELFAYQHSYLMTKFRKQNIE